MNNEATYTSQRRQVEQVGCGTPRCIEIFGFFRDSSNEQ